MTPEVAKELTVITNSKQAVDSLVLYVNDRLETIRKEYDLCDTLEQVKVLQGKAQEVKRLLNLRDQVIQVLK